jgi:hypothetical protein
MSHNESPSPSPYGNLLGYQSVNVIDPTYSQFQRNFVIDDYYLTIFGSKFDQMRYSVQYTKKYIDGRTIWYTEILGLIEINELLDRLENLDRLTEKKLDVINSVRQSEIDQQIESNKDAQLGKLTPKFYRLYDNPSASKNSSHGDHRRHETHITHHKDQNHKNQQHQPHHHNK